MREQDASQKSKTSIVKHAVKRLTRFEKIRFVLVGGINTSVDFILLITFTSMLGIPASFANIASTSIALLVSYSLNKKAVFGNTDPNNHRQLLLFVVVTLFGLWGLQTIVIAFSSSILSSWLGLAHSSVIILIIAKVLATCVSLTWNYIWYSRVIFSQKKPTKG
jgi:putative flippase GtrA